MSNEEETQKKSLELFRKNVQHFKTKPELSIYACAMVALGAALLRGIEGHKFTDGFLTGALNETKTLVITPEELH